MGPNESQTNPSPDAPDQIPPDQIPPDQIPPSPKALIEAALLRAMPVGPAALDGSRQLVRRATVTFRMSGSDCAPGFFVDSEGDPLELVVTLEALSGTEEMNALSGLSAAEQAPFLLAKAAVRSINDVSVLDTNRDLLWEAFGMGGRQLCMMAFQHLGSVGAASLGKFRRSLTVA